MAHLTVNTGGPVEKGNEAVDIITKQPPRSALRSSAAKAATARQRSTVSFYEEAIATATLRQQSRVDRETSVVSTSGNAWRSRFARQGSVMSTRQVHRAQWQSFLDSCCGSLQHCGRDSDADMEELKSDAEIDSHKISLRNIYKRFGTDPRCGLSDVEVQERLDTCGLNRIRPPPVLPEWFKFFKHLSGGFCLLLWVGSLLCFIAYGLQASTSDEVPSDNLYLGAVLAVVVTITGTFSYFQEAKSSKIMDSFKKFMPSYATAIRMNCETVVPVEELVPGDIVTLKGGDKIPADCRIVSCSNFKVDNSCLTGESEPQTRSPDCTNDNPLETKNLVFFSTYALEGTAIAVVVATGDHTVMGRIARLATGIKQKKTPLSRELEYFVVIICWYSIIIGGAFFAWVLYLNPSNWIGAVVFGVGIIIGNVPSGVLIEVALCLTLAAKQMAKHNALVKNLDAVETLGSTSTICSDKTGTLTQNKMTVAHLWFNSEIHVADISKEQTAAEEYKADGESNGWSALIRVASLCSRAVFKTGQDNVDIMSRECIGDGSESGLLKFSERSIGSVEKYRATWPKKAEIPFSSATKFQVSVHKRVEDGRFIVAMKGAPERVIDMCSTMWLGEDNGGEVPITAEVKDYFQSVYAELGGMGERVLGFADLLLPSDSFPPNFNFATEPEPNFPLNGLRFVGLIGMMDPPRPSVPDAVRKCREAGIRVVMVTGDHPLTAKAIAKMVGIFSPDSKTVEDIAKERSLPVSAINSYEANAVVIAGTQLRDMSSQELDAVIARYNEIVFARTSPQQKLQIVEGFQRAGLIVAVTGDGVNDSPALKQADIGIAMGITGSDVSKQAADMILMDDNFATIVLAVEEGRLLFDNLKKTIYYVLTGNTTEIAAALGYVIFQCPLPLSTVGMLVISLATDMAPAVMLAHEPTEADIMRRKPRNSKVDTLITFGMMSISYGQSGMLEIVAAFFAYMVCLAENGFLPSNTFFAGLSHRWDCSSYNDLEDSYGQEWTYDQRKQLEHTLYSVYFIAVIVMQWTCCICAKARRMYLHEHGWRNHRLLFGLIFETSIAFFVCYCPGVNSALFLAPVRWHWWLPALPFAFVFLLTDQLRKYAIRNAGPGSSIEHDFLF